MIYILNFSEKFLSAKHTELLTMAVALKIDLVLLVYTWKMLTKQEIDFDKLPFPTNSFFTDQRTSVL